MNNADKHPRERNEKKKLEWKKGEAGMLKKKKKLERDFIDKEIKRGIRKEERKAAV